MTQENQWEYWQSACHGVFLETLIQRGNPQSGYYRDRSKRAVAIWRDEDGWLQCAVTGGYAPQHADEIDELFGAVCRQPISRELFMTIRHGGAWPETVPVPERGAGDNNPPSDLTPDQAMVAEIVALQQQCREWLKSLPGGKPSSKIEADLAANYADKFLGFEQKAIAAHKAEKEPHLSAGRECDARWFGPVRDVAKSLKEKIKAIALAWADAEDARKAEEARVANQEQRRLADEANRRARESADRAGAPPPPPVRAVEVAAADRTKVGTDRAISNTSRAVYVVTDIRAFAGFLAELDPPPPDFVEALRKIATRLGSAGANPPGVEKRISGTAS